jgi:hemoglobin/transferrin/lactoferrin receptor protein
MHKSSLLLLPALLCAGSPALAQRDSTCPDSTRAALRLAPVTVTATRTERSVFLTPTPVLVLDSSTVRRETPDGVADLFRNLPGVDVTGVGPNQTRLILRGQRGQRILLAEDGIRLNNSRRQQDFGELPAFTDINSTSRVEVIRGPASVLYGTDAIGGVVNQLTMRAPMLSSPEGVSGSALFRYGSASEQQTWHGILSGRTGRLGFALSAGYRDASEYLSPSGTFGALTLHDRTLVHDTGLIDRNFSADLSYSTSMNSAVTLRVSRYAARDAGFGYVSPTDMGDPEGATVRLLYPDQDVTRVTAGFRSTALGWGIADRLGVTFYTTQNERTFTQDIAIPLGQPFPPGSGISIDSRNYTDIGTYGTRLELARAFGRGHVITYGVDWYLDDSENADTSVTVTRMFGPPTTRTSTTPTVPYASLWSGGAYAQASLWLSDRLNLGLGVRGQTIKTETHETPGLGADRAGVSTSDGTVVGGASLGYRISSSVNLVGNLGRAFRAPNLVERYFQGSAEGSGFQIANPDLAPETSLNVDLGVKVRTSRLYAEVSWFRNQISDAIRAVEIDTTVNNLPGFQNQNVETLTDHGLEFLAELDAGAGFSLLGHFTTISSTSDDDAPVGDGYSSKIGGEVMWREAKGRFFAGYEIRHQGERDDVEFTGNPVGEVIPSFTVHNTRAGIRLPVVGTTSSQLTVAVMNLTDQLYSEASNTSFFRPEPRRSAVIGIRLDF